MVTPSLGIVTCVGERTGELMGEMIGGRKEGSWQGGAWGAGGQEGGHVQQAMSDGTLHNIQNLPKQPPHAHLEAVPAEHKLHNALHLAGALEEGQVLLGPGGSKQIIEGLVAVAVLRL